MIANTECIVCGSYWYAEIGMRTYDSRETAAEKLLREAANKNDFVCPICEDNNEWLNEGGHL